MAIQLKVVFATTLFLNSDCSIDLIKNEWKISFELLFIIFMILVHGHELKWGNEEYIKLTTRKVNLFNYSIFKVEAKDTRLFRSISLSFDGQSYPVLVSGIVEVRKLGQTPPSLKKLFWLLYLRG